MMASSSFPSFTKAPPPDTPLIDNPSFHIIRSQISLMLRGLVFGLVNFGNCLLLRLFMSFLGPSNDAEFGKSNERNWLPPMDPAVIAGIGAIICMETCNAVATVVPLHGVVGIAKHCISAGINVLGNIVVVFIYARNDPGAIRISFIVSQIFMWIIAIFIWRAIFVGIDRQKVIKVNGVDTRSWCLHILAHFIESIISMIAISFFPIVIAGGFQISMLHRHNFFIVLLICGTFPISQVVVGWAFLQTFNGSDFITEAGTESYFLSLYVSFLLPSRTLLLLTATDFTTPQVAVSVSSQIISKLVPRIIGLFYIHLKKYKERLELEEKMSKNEAQPAEDLSNHWESTSWNLMRSRDGKVVPVMDMEDKRSNTLEDSSSCQEVKIDCVRHSDTEIDPHPRVLISVTEGDTSFISHNLSKSDDAQSRLFTPTSQHFVQSNNSRLSLTSNPFSTTSTLQRPQMRPATVSSSMYRPRASQFHRAVEATVHVLVKMTDMERAYESSRRDQALAEYLALSIGLSVILAFPGDVGVKHVWRAVLAWGGHLVVAVVLELGILMVEAYHGLETYNSNQYPWVHAIAFSFASAMHAFWIVSASKKLFSYGAFGPTKPWPWQDL